MSYLIQGNHLSKSYRNETVLSDVNIHVSRGDIYGLIGRNGSGKTTLLRIITGLIPKYGGTVSIMPSGGGQPTRVAAVIGDPGIFLNLDCRGNLECQAKLLDLKNTAEINQVLSTVGLAGAGKKLARDYSLGMKQRLKLALALLGKPDVLILDEPLNGLDPDGIAELRDLLRNLNRSGITIIISSHILAELEQVATRFGILHDGRIVTEIETKDITSVGGSLEKLYLTHTRRNSML
jgi:ABC-type multidrug transport system ATPase subunit